VIKISVSSRIKKPSSIYMYHLLYTRSFLYQCHQSNIKTPTLQQSLTIGVWSNNYTIEKWPFINVMPVFFTSIVYIWFFNHNKAVNHTPVNMRKCQIKLSLHVKIIQKERLCWKSVARKIWLYLCFDPLRQTVKQLDFNRYVQLSRWHRGNASDCGAWYPWFNSRLWKWF